MKSRQVAGGLLFDKGELLLVKNDRPYSKTSDWTTPGGVIDKGETVLEGLTREVIEETGLVVSSWEGPAYLVQVDFLDRGFFLKVEAFIANSWEGKIIIEDPDGIVTNAIFCDSKKQTDLLLGSPIWVREPLLEWQAKQFKNTSGNTSGILKFEYEVKGYGLDDFEVVRRFS